MTDYGIDGHKLTYHPERVAAWARGEDVAPLYLEVGLVGRCMHRCVFCAFDYSNYSGPTLPPEVLMPALDQAAKLGLKSVMFAGEGEPLLYPSLGLLAANCHESMGLDISITTNGVLFDSRLAAACLPHLTWIRFSLDAASAATYNRVHRGGPDDFRKVVTNIQIAANMRNNHSWPCTIGVQAVMIPDNAAELVSVGALAKECGADYFSVKPFSKHPFSLCSFDMEYSRVNRLARRVGRLSGDGFKAVFRSHAMGKLDEPRPYTQCLALPFVTYIACTGEVYACSAFLGNPAFVYGNIHEQSFGNIWAGERRCQVLEHIAQMGVAPCREICRLDEMNRYLWGVRHPETVPHVNFP